jgi:hypothetical protein
LLAYCCCCAVPEFWLGRLFNELQLKLTEELVNALLQLLNGVC